MNWINSKYDYSPPNLGHSTCALKIGPFHFVFDCVIIDTKIACIVVGIGWKKLGHQIGVSYE